MRKQIEVSPKNVITALIVVLALFFGGDYLNFLPGEAAECPDCLEAAGDLVDQVNVAKADLDACNAQLDTSSLAYDQLNTAYQDTVAAQNDTATQLGLCQAQLEDYTGTGDDAAPTDVPDAGVDLEPVGLPACADFVIVTREPQAAFWKVDSYNGQDKPVMVKVTESGQIQVAEAGAVFLVFGHTEKDLDGKVTCTGAVTADGGGLFYEIVGPYNVGLFLRVQDVEKVIE